MRKKWYKTNFNLWNKKTWNQVVTEKIFSVSISLLVQFFHIDCLFFRYFSIFLDISIIDLQLMSFFSIHLLWFTSTVIESKEINDDIIYLHVLKVYDKKFSRKEKNRRSHRFACVFLVKTWFLVYRLKHRLQRLWHLIFLVKLKVYMLIIISII